MPIGEASPTGEALSMPCVRTFGPRVATSPRELPVSQKGLSELRAAYEMRYRSYASGTSSTSLPCA